MIFIHLLIAVFGYYSIIVNSRKYKDLPLSYPILLDFFLDISLALAGTAKTMAYFKWSF